jgi:hypothetical protein
MECPFFKCKRQLLIKQVGHTVNSQWFLEQVENVNIKHYIKHSSPWQWYAYYFNSAYFLEILFEEGCQCLNRINILQIALSLQNISIKHINIKINVYFWQPGFKKGDNWNANGTHPFIFSWSAIIGPKLFFTRYNDRQSSEQNNRKLISLHNNGDGGKHAHGFADF